MDMIRRNRYRPDQTFVIVMLFSDTGQQPPDTDAIAAHDDRLGLPFFILKGTAERIAVACAEFENIADLNAAHSFERLSAVGAGITFTGRNNVRDNVGLKSRS